MIATAPEAATLAYLSQMSPQALAKATAYTHGKEWLILGGWVVSMATTWLIVRSGLLNRVKDGLQKETPRPLLASLLVGLCYFFVSSLLELPWSIYSDWWFETSFGMTSQSLADWFVDGLKTGWFGLLMGSVFVVRIDDDTAKLRLLIVDPSARGLGVGRMLTTAAIDFARARGYRRMVLWTMAMLDAARGIYAKAGFRCTDSTTGFSYGREITDETWVLELI